MSTTTVIVTTKHRGVFWGSPDGYATGDEIIHLNNARMCIYWSGRKGILGLAENGPLDADRIGATAPRIELRDITAVIGVTDKAAAAWTSA